MFAGVLLAGCSSSSDWGRQVFAGAGPDVASLKVTGTEPVRSEGPSRLSPDGTRVLRMTEPCVTAVDGTGERCVERDGVSVDLPRAWWSPDSTKIVFTNDYWRRFDEPDVWVFDVVGGELTNLTDDGVDDYKIGDPDRAARIDLLPSWSPDGSAVRFARGVPERESVELVSVGADGGEVSTVREIDCGPHDLVALAWSADRVAWTCGMDEPEVWLAGLDGGDPERVLPGAEDEDRMSLSFSPDGEWLLVDSITPYSQREAPDRGLATAVPTGGGDPVPVADGAVAYPAWSPGGHALAYVEPPGTVTVVAEPGGEPKELHTADLVLAPDAMRLGWVYGSLLVHVDGEPTLLRLSG
ncbi:TolB family protein [Actinophytocola gossypii]|uniref:Uncharacterized protein n=1 Tax=Actinophytocola gossypii TaxID=2812003 RepID=A0ABT2JIV5_9PSEU|nr:hypothetical protein [Actinophytocola gossypii]MCT2587812.1 hypothetical protein [Actinophytocola gossypii]